MGVGARPSGSIVAAFATCEIIAPRKISPSAATCSPAVAKRCSGVRAHERSSHPSIAYGSAGQRLVGA